MKKPGEFKKQQKKHQNIQHNRDQIKLLKEEKITEAHLFVLDPDGFKKVTIKTLPNCLGPGWVDVVYLSHHGRKSKLRTGTIVEKDSGNRCRTVNEGFIEWKHVFGVITNVEMLKGKDRANEAPIKQASVAK